MNNPFSGLIMQNERLVIPLANGDGKHEQNAGSEDGQAEQENPEKPRRGMPDEDENTLSHCLGERIRVRNPVS